MQFDTNEDEKLMQYAERWQKDLEVKFPKRHYKTSVIDVNGKNVFLTRFFKALQPPPEVIEKTTSELQAVSDSIDKKIFLYIFPYNIPDLMKTHSGYTWFF